MEVVLKVGIGHGSSSAILVSILVLMEVVLKEKGCEPFKWERSLFQSLF
ncbi:Uncharacterized protein dnm_098350 [Desulfonema magnum]|uniref:Uncharacterized protein n=1 Tax=Desulfonema magnum TaxID=45655 RepID=A0A975GU53_9BACT|nr:Uncharacterized protein dnm_098350 [Desulfonema magnum]